ncbi:MAG: histidine phosphatase family protein [Chloroflexi bacterium]|nr:histidine phosphatase family protein [Chloroflexota bacterium]
MADRESPVFHITFVRHGESIGNAENRFQGQSDYPLSETGRAQARALAERWQTEGAVFDYGIASPLSRALETAQIISSALGNFPIELDPLWMERDNGKRSGLTVDEVQLRFPDPEFVTPFDSVGETGEGDWALYLRGGQALHKILQRPPGRYLVATHGAILNMTLYAILGIAPQPNLQGARFRLENTSFSAFRYYPETHRWRVDVIGDRVHWKESKR